MVSSAFGAVALLTPEAENTRATLMRGVSGTALALQSTPVVRRTKGTGVVANWKETHAVSGLLLRKIVRKGRPLRCTMMTVAVKARGLPLLPCEPLIDLYRLLTDNTKAAGQRRLHARITKAMRAFTANLWDLTARAAHQSDKRAHILYDLKIWMLSAS